MTDIAITYSFAFPELLPPANAQTPPPPWKGPTPPNPPYPPQPPRTPHFPPGLDPRIGPPGQNNLDPNRSLSDSEKASAQFLDTVGAFVKAAGTTMVIVGVGITGYGIITANPSAIIAGASGIGTGALVFGMGLVANYGANSIRNYHNAYDPIVIDLNGDGIHFTPTSVAVDADRDGYIEASTWISNDDGLLVWDKNDDGKITDSDELTVGNTSSDTDLTHLSDFDSNGDGVLDSSDEKFGELRVWQDLNGNGVTDSGELSTLADRGITSISLDVTPVTAQPTANGTILDSTQITTVTGTLSAYSVALNFDPNGAHVEVLNSNDVAITFEDGRSFLFHSIQETTGATFDLTATPYNGVIGNIGNDILSTTGDENVFLFGGDGSDTLSGGAGGDFLIGGAGVDLLSGGAGNDILVVDGNDDLIHLDGGAGIDIAIVEGGSGVTIDLSATHLEGVVGGAGDDVLSAVGVSSSVVLSGEAGNDTLTGGSGDDALQGDAGADSLSGGGGNDILYVDAGDTLVDGGAGIDSAYVLTPDSVTLNLTTSSIERAYGNDGNDVFVATGSQQVLMIGGKGNDSLSAGSGDDRLVGAEGNDIVDGGAGLDVAVFGGKSTDYSIVASGSGYVVTDLNTADGDDGVDTITNVERLEFTDTTIHLDPSNARPEVQGELLRIRDNGADVALASTDLLANDRDADNDRLRIAAVSHAKGGDVTITSAGEIWYDSANGTGSGAFDYLVDDGHGGTGWATASVEVSQALPTDDLLQYQWNLVAGNVYDVWDDYTGAGVDVLIIEGGVDFHNPDLESQFDQNAYYNPADHGTAVSGIVGAGRNGFGTVGVAYDSQLSWTFGPGLFTSYPTTIVEDVVNNSWLSNVSTIASGFDNRFIRYAVEQTTREGRGGLGVITVFAAGNERSIGEDSNILDGQNSRFAIDVGAIDSTGRVTDFSDAGVNLLVVAPGSQIVSTDMLGNEGFSDGSSIFGDQYGVMDGTSAAAPFVTGVAALMLQANPNLGWRDVQEILAYSAWNTDPTNSTWNINGATNWNGGGLHFSRDYGFGLVDARAAVRLAETWDVTSNSANEVSSTATATINEAIPDNNGQALTSRLTLTDHVNIDHVELHIDLDHSNVGDLIIELTSPDGTTSLILDRLGVTASNATGSALDGFEWTFMSNEFWGEDSVGEWTLTVRDAVTGEVGHVNSWSVTAYGDAPSDDDTYIYTPDYGTLTSGIDAGRHILTDSDGYDTINAATIFDNTILDLHSGATSELAGGQLTIAAGTIIERAFLGDGDDRAIGNEVDNFLSGGRGNDMLEGGAGADYLDGGRGSDTASYSTSGAAVTINLTTRTAEGGDATGDTLVSIENLQGSQSGDSLTGDATNNVLSGEGGDDLLSGGAGDDWLGGGQGSDALVGGAGDDVLVGAAGDDTINGGSGSDTAVFSGRYADYTISRDGEVITVTGADGTDHLSDVEFLRFDDGTYTTAVGNHAPTAPTYLTTYLSQRIPVGRSQTQLLAGITDQDGDVLSIEAVYASAHGLLTLTSQNGIRFEVDPDFVGTTTFDYVVSDGKGGEVRVTYSFTVSPTISLSGSSAADTLLGLGSADTFSGGGGNDYLDGGYGDDRLLGGAGNDDLIGAAGADRLDGGAGSDTTHYDNSTTAVSVNLLSGTASGGDAAGDVLVSIENVVGSAKNDVLTGDRSANNLSGLAGDDILDGGVGADTLSGGDGADLLIGGSGDDLLLGGSGLDVLRGGAGADRLDGGFGIDFASYADAGTAVTINLETGVKTGADAVGDVFVSIEGVEGSQFDDQLIGSSAADVLAGGHGNDLLQGQAGSDTYNFEIGDGNDTIIESADSTGVDHLVFGHGLNSRDLTIVRPVSDANDVTLLFANGDSAFIDQQFYGSGGYGVEQIRFGNNETWTVADLRNAYLRQVETGGNDTVLGFNNADDTIQGRGGDDTLRGLSGSDTYIYNADDGNDSIIEVGATTDADRLVLGAGLLPGNVTIQRSITDTDDVTLLFANGSVFLDEQFYGGNQGYGVESIRFGNGTVWSAADLEVAYLAQAQTSGNDLVWGFNTKNDTLQGGAGDDALRGLGGSDTYIYNSGDGNDGIYESAGSDSDQLVLGAGLLAQDIVIERSSSDQDDVTLSFSGHSGSIFLDEQFAGSGNGVELIVFGDGRTWTSLKLLQEADGIVATAGNDSLYGAGNLDDSLQGLQGDDRLYGYSGSDTYTYGAGDGNDTIYEATVAGDTDRLVFTAGIAPQDVTVERSSADLDDVTLHIGTSGSVLLDEQFALGGGSGVETVEFSDGTVWTADDIKAASIVYSATSGNDNVRGFENRDDQIAGGAGDDALYGYSGSDTFHVSLNDGADTIYEDAGTSSLDQIIFGAGLAAADLIVHRSAADSSDMALSFNGSSGTIVIDNQFSVNGAIEQVAFDDGTILSRADLLKLYAGVDATAGNDTLSGGGYLWGKQGDDTLSGSGYTYYYYDHGDGHDIIQGADGVLILGPDISPDDVVGTRDPNDLYTAVLHLDDGGTITLKNYLNYAGPGEIHFADGTVWDRDQVFGYATLLGTAGDDNLQGTIRDDTIRGAAGDDYLAGGSGSDTYVFAAGDGNDTIYEVNNSYPHDTDVLRLVGLNSSDILVGKYYSDINIQIISTGEIINLSYQTTDGYGIEEVAFADGTSWNRADLLANAILLGTADDDYIFGDSSDDHIRGGLGNDQLYGGQGADTYEYAAGDGYDTIDETQFPDEAQDILRFLDLDASDVSLSIDETSLIVTINSTGERIEIVGQFSGALGQGYDSDGVELIAFSDGTTWDRGQIEANANFTPPLLEVIGTESADTLNGDYWDNDIQGLGGDDTIAAAGGDDTIDAGAGGDLVHGDVGDDVIIGGDGNDTLYGDDGDDTFIATSGDGNDAFDGGNGSFDLVDFSGISTAVDANLATGTATGADIGSDTLLNIEGIDGGSGADTLTGDAASNGLFGMEGNDTLKGGAGNDYLDGGAGADTYLFNLGDGQDQISDSGLPGEIDKIIFGAGINPDDVVFTIDYQGDFGFPALIIGGGSDEIFLPGLFDDPSYFIEEVHFQDGTIWTIDQLAAQYLASQISEYGDYITGTGLDDTIDGGEGDDSIDGADGNDTLLGSTGDDGLRGGAGSDVLNGGVGDDYLRGNAGSDSYLYAAGDGSDTINDQSDGDPADIDALVLSDLNVADLQFTKAGSSLVITVVGTGDIIEVDSQFGSDFEPDGIEEIHFQDGTVWHQSDILTSVNIDPNAEYLTGTDGNDVFNGGLGDDTIDSGPGSDRFIYASGDGNDLIYDGWSSTTEVDTLQLTDLNPEDVTFRHLGNDLVVTTIATGQTITIQGEFQSFYYNYGIDRVEFANGVVWNRDLILQTPTFGTAGNDQLYGSDLADTFTAGLGDDYISGAGGADTFIYASGDGSDTISDSGSQATEIDTLNLVGLTAADVVLTHSGTSLLVQVVSTGDTITVNDQFYATNRSYGIEHIAFGDGTNWDLSEILANAWYRGTSGSDSLTGSAFSEVFFGDAGDDTMSGGAGSDTFVIKPGFGHDTISDFSVADGDVVEFSTDVFADFSSVVLAATQVGSDVVIAFDNDNSLTLSNLSLSSLDVNDFHFSTFGSVGSEPVTLVGDALDNVLTGADGNDQLSGDAGNDTLNGGFGNDVLDGGTDNDTLKGGFGDDTLQGGAGSDIYIFNPGHGHDLVVEAGLTGDMDSLVLGAGIATSDVRVEHGADDIWDLVLRIGDDTITVDDQFLDNSRVDEVHFADGTIWTAATLRDEYLSQASTNADDAIDGFNVDDVIHAGAGDDSVSGYDGNDTLAGETGNDDLYGMEGSDTYLFNLGDGSDWIHESGVEPASDTLVFGAGIDPNEITIGRGPSPEDLTLTLASGDEVSVIGQFAGGADTQVEQFQFANGTTWSAQDVQETYLAQMSTGGNDAIDGFLSNDLIDGGAGNDNLDGREGNDTLIGGGGDDHLTGGAGNDTFVFAAGFGNDTIADFTPGSGTDDVIEFDGVFADFDAMIAAASEVNGDTVISSAGNGSVVLQGVQLAALHQDDFRFAA